MSKQNFSSKFQIWAKMIAAPPRAIHIKKFRTCVHVQNLSKGQKTSLIYPAMLLIVSCPLLQTVTMMKTKTLLTLRADGWIWGIPQIQVSTNSTAVNSFFRNSSFCKISGSFFRNSPFCKVFGYLKISRRLPHFAGYSFWKISTRITQPLRIPHFVG